MLTLHMRPGQATRGIESRVIPLHQHHTMYADRHKRRQVEAGELARRQLAAAESRAAELERHLAASRDAMRDAELKLQQERAKHGPAESVAELMAMITTLRQEVALKQTRLEQANAGLERLQAARKEAQQAARDLQVSEFDWNRTGSCLLL